MSIQYNQFWMIIHAFSSFYKLRFASSCPSELARWHTVFGKHVRRWSPTKNVAPVTEGFVDDGRKPRRMQAEGGQEITAFVTGWGWIGKRASPNSLLTSKSRPGEEPGCPTLAARLAAMVFWSFGWKR